jgi:hypothetical protein
VTVAQPAAAATIAATIPAAVARPSPARASGPAWRRTATTSSSPMTVMPTALARPNANTCRPAPNPAENPSAASAAIPQPAAVQAAAATVAPRAYRARESSANNA